MAVLRAGPNYFGNGGKGGGGIAGFLTNLPTDGLNNTGSGGGGNKDYGKSGAGGSGTVIVRYKPYIEYYYKQIYECVDMYRLTCKPNALEHNGLSLTKILYFDDLVTQIGFSLQLLIFSFA